MAKIAVDGCMCMCLYGSMPATLKALSQAKVLVGGRPACTIMDTTFSVMPTFGICTSPIPPAPVPIPAPCSCAIAPGTWIGANPAILADNKPVLQEGASIICLARAGMISIKSAMQPKVI